MPFVFFREYYGELAEQETRTITLLQAADGLPAGEYGFLEMFCDEPGCDCRRVLLQVFSLPREKFEAVIAFGWGSPEFYATWIGDDDPATIAELQGPVLNPGSPRSELAPAVLELARRLLLRDRRYVNRLKQHYSLMRAEVERRAGGVARRTRRVGRNEPCPCGSGRKYKKCCGSTAEQHVGAAEGAGTVPGGGTTSTAQWIDEIRIGKEVDYIIDSAADRVARVVRLGSLTLFSTFTGDAWILDTSDSSALPLARNGERLPARIFESEHKFAIEWTHDYAGEGDELRVVDRSTGEECVLTGALVREILEIPM